MSVSLPALSVIWLAEAGYDYTTPVCFGHTGVCGLGGLPAHRVDGRVSSIRGGLPNRVGIIFHSQLRSATEGKAPGEPLQRHCAKRSALPHAQSASGGARHCSFASDPPFTLATGAGTQNRFCSGLTWSPSLTANVC